MFNTTLSRADTCSLLEIQSNRKSEQCLFLPSYVVALQSLEKCGHEAPWSQGWNMNINTMNINPVCYLAPVAVTPLTHLYLDLCFINSG